MTWVVAVLIALAPLIIIAVLVGVVIFGLRQLAKRSRAQQAAASGAAMHARDDERRAREVAWFDAFRRGVGRPDLAPHEWYETAEEYDWDRARLTVLGYEVIESWRHQQEDGSVVYEVLYQGHLDELQRAARKLATI